MKKNLRPQNISQVRIKYMPFLKSLMFDHFEMSTHGKFQDEIQRTT